MSWFVKKSDIMISQNSDIKEIMKQIVQFTKDRDWDQFHNGKDLALALSIEASELNEAFFFFFFFFFLGKHTF